MKKLVYVIAAVALMIGCTSQQEKRNSTKVQDTTAPFINASVFEFSTSVGKPLDLSNITGYDDVDGLLPTYLKGEVDYDVANDYQPELCCKDASGNESCVTINIHVLPEDKYPLSKEQADSLEQNDTLENLEPCKLPNAKDASYPCRVVLPSDLQKYRVVYPGIDHKETCESNLKDNEECELILCNDGSEFGYGIVEKEK